MTSRTQYMVFLTCWAGAIFVGFIIALAYGFKVGRYFNLALVLFGLVALVPAAAGYVVILKVRELIDDWRVSRGDNVYQERAHEDDSGFLHLYEVSAHERQEDAGLREMVSGMKPLLDHITKDSDDSEG